MKFYDASLSARLMKKKKIGILYIYNRFSLRSCTKIDLVCTTTAIDRWYISGEKTLIEFFSFLRKRSFFPSLKMTKHYNYSSNHVFALQTKREGEKEMKEIWSLYTFPFYIWRRIWEKLFSLSKVDRKKKKGGARVRDPLRYFRAALGSGLVQKYVNACVACPWILKSCFLEANPHLLFLFRRASPSPSFHASIGSRKNTGTCYGQHVPPLPKNSWLGNTRRIMRHNASFFDSCTSLRETFDAT